MRRLHRSPSFTVAPEEPEVVAGVVVEAVGGHDG